MLSIKFSSTAMPIKADRKDLETENAICLDEAKLLFQ